MPEVNSGTARRGSVGQPVAELIRDVEGLADDGPDSLGVDPGVQRLIDGLTVEGGEDVVVGHRRCPLRTEVGAHQRTEFGQPHRTRP